MFLSDISGGLMIGLPVMLTLGPISLLLLNQGMDRGAKRALPGALGVASADLTYSSLAALAGTTLVAVLNPIAPILRVGGIAVLIWMAWKLASDSKRDVAELKRAEHPEASEVAALTTVGVAATGVGMATGAPSGEAVDGTVSQGPLAHLDGARLGAAFYGLTLMNPMTIVLLSAVVIAGGPGIGTAGWAVGMTLSSLMAHSGYVLIGSVLRRTCSQLTLARMGTVSAVVLVFLSVHLAFT